MMKLEGGCMVKKSRPSSNLGVIAPWVRTPKNVALGYDVGKIIVILSLEGQGSKYFTLLEHCNYAKIAS